MINVTSDYKNNIKRMGRQLDSIITYTIDEDETVLGKEDLNSVSPHYQGDLLKSVMKQLDIDSNVEIPIGTEINYQFGIKVGNSYEYRDYGNYIVKEVEKQEDTRSYKITCYDKMLYAMKDYEAPTITYPTTIRAYITALCTKIGLVFANENDTFVNYDKSINSELYLTADGESLDYTFRDVLDELAQVTASCICINNNNELEIRYVNNADVLPNGYTQVEYIQTSSGSCYIDTGLVGNNKTKFEMKINPAVVTNNRHLLGNIVTSSRAISFNTRTDGQNAISRWGNKQLDSTTLGFVANTDYLIEVSENGYYANGSLIWQPTQNDFETNGNVYIMNVKNSTGYGSGLYGKLYYAKIYQNDVLVRYFVPCYRNSDSVIGLYDIVNDSFYENQGSGTLTKGNNKVNVIDTIDEEFLKDINVNFGEKYGPINSVVFTRSGGSDSIYEKDDASILTNGLCELKIEDNQILNGNNRNDFMIQIFEKLNGLEYYLNDYSSTGITYYELMDKYNVKIDENYYSCIMLNDDIMITQGLEESVHTDRIGKSETDYTKADKTDRKINQAFIIVDKQNQEINSVVRSISNLTNMVDSQGNDIESLGTLLQQTIDGFTANVTTIQETLENGVTLVKTLTVTINDQGLSVATDTSKTNTLMTPDKFSIIAGDKDLAFFGYDETDNTTKAVMDNLTVTNYFVSGYHRTEKMEINSEYRTGVFYIGGGI